MRIVNNLDVLLASVTFTSNAFYSFREFSLDTGIYFLFRLINCLICLIINLLASFLIDYSVRLFSIPNVLVILKYALSDRSIRQ